VAKVIQSKEAWEYEVLLRMSPPRQSLRRGRQKTISPHGSGFQKSNLSPETVLNDFTPSNTLAWLIVTRQGGLHHRVSLKSFRSRRSFISSPLWTP